MSLDKRTGKPLGKIFKPQEIDTLLEKHGLAKPKEEGEGGAAAASTSAPAASGTAGDSMNVDS